jgi:hypothetical protein
MELKNRRDFLTSAAALGAVGIVANTPNTPAGGVATTIRSSLPMPMHGAPDCGLAYPAALPPPTLEEAIRNWFTSALSLDEDSGLPPLDFIYDFHRAVRAIWDGLIPAERRIDARAIRLLLADQTPEKPLRMERVLTPWLQLDLYAPVRDWSRAAEPITLPGAITVPFGTLPTVIFNTPLKPPPARLAESIRVMLADLAAEALAPTKDPRWKIGPATAVTELRGPIFAIDFFAHRVSEES